MTVIPVTFRNNGGVELPQNAKMIMEHPSELLRIHKSQQNLITGLRTAWVDNFKFYKEQTSYDDLLDAFRLSLWKYKFNK